MGIIIAEDGTGAVVKYGCGVRQIPRVAMIMAVVRTHARNSCVKSNEHHHHRGQSTQAHGGSCTECKNQPHRSEVTFFGIGCSTWK